MADEWEVSIKRKITRLSFTRTEEPEGEQKISCSVESSDSIEGPLGTFECDAQDINGLKNLLIKHGVIEGP